MSLSFRHLLASPMLLALIGGVAHADAPRALETYPAQFFSSFAPQTALEMVQQVPGFRLDTGNEGMRGYSDAGGNVLIDGARPASKSGGLTAALSAIPARQVVRIEIMRGGVATTEASGQAVVANIVLLPRTTTLAVGAKLALSGGHPTGSASVTATRRLGSFELGSRTALDAPGERSHGARTALDAAGRVTGEQDLTYRSDFPELSQRLTLSGPLGGGQLKAAASLAGARLAEGFSFAGDAGVESFPKRTRRWRGEASGDWSRKIGDGHILKLLALASAVDVDARSFTMAGASETTLETTDLFENKALSRETILRAALARGGDAPWRWEVGAEFARNSLDSHSTSTQFALGSDAPRSRVASEIFVSEQRGVAFATLDGRLSTGWSVAAGLSYELSTIRAESETINTQRFGFLKPSVAISYRPNDRNDLRLSVKRSVGQLSFGDFAASANPAEGKAFGGNANLGPDHRTTLALDYNGRFGGRGAVGLGAFHDWRGDVLEAAILPSGVAGVANVARARIWGISARLELPVDPVVRGGLLKLSYARQGSEVADPVTGARRGITGLRPETLTASFRQDLGKLSWGADYAKGYSVQTWFVDEAREQLHAQDLSLYVETGRLAGSRVRLQLEGLTGARNSYRRALYAPDRARGVGRAEIWTIGTPLTARISVDRSF